MNWRHVVCDDCWVGRLRKDSEPVRLRHPDPDFCCLCGVVVSSPIYIKIDPKDDRLLCKGNHEKEA